MCGAENLTGAPYVILAVGMAVGMAGAGGPGGGPVPWRKYPGSGFSKITEISKFAEICQRTKSHETRTATTGHGYMYIYATTYIHFDYAKNTAFMVLRNDMPQHIFAYVINR